MTIGFNLVLALFILAPGFGVLAGIYAGSQGGKYRPAPPAPNSIIGLAIVACGALVAHAAAALILAVSVPIANAIYSITGWGIPTPANPNPYVAILNAEKVTPAPADIAWAPVLFVIVTLLSFLLANAEVRKDLSRGLYGKLLYGWLADLVEEASDTTEGDRYVSAFVLTDMENDGAYLGYEGFLENITVGPEKELISVVLTEANTFYVSMGDTAVVRKDAAKERPIARLHFTAEQVKNLAFQVFLVEPPAPGGESAS